MTTCAVYPWPALPAAEVGTGWLFIYYLQCQLLPLACSVKIDLRHLTTSWPDVQLLWQRGKFISPSRVLQSRLLQAHTVGLPGTVFIVDWNFLTGWVHMADTSVTSQWYSLLQGVHLPTLTLVTLTLQACFPRSHDYMFVCFLLTERETFKWQLISKPANKLESLKILSHQ